MSVSEFAQNLFNSHLLDCNDVLQDEGTTIFCPICLHEYSEGDLENGNLTIGHVWPEYFRRKNASRIASIQRVLLCRKCNSAAGSRGDKQMQLREDVKGGEKTGYLHDERKIHILPTLGKRPIELRGKVILRQDEMIEGRLSFQVDKSTGEWLRTNPREQERFLDITKGDKFTMIVFAPHELQSNLAAVGWITSAYLLAFFTFGYRYILHKGLDMVRNHIVSSFDDKATNTLEIPGLDNFGLTECKEHFFKDPEIGLVIPTDDERKTHLRVSYLDYHIRLPLHFVPHVLQAMIQSVPEIARLFPDIIGTDALLYSPVLCNKTDFHDCKWDYILGKPLPNVNR